VLMYIVNEQAIEQNERIKGDKKELGMDKDEAFNLGEFSDDIEEGRSPKQALDSFLSGYYLIENIVYRHTEGETKQIVTLLRREWPTRTENLINPPGLEDATDEEKAENVAENSPAPTTEETTEEPVEEPVEETTEETTEEPVEETEEEAVEETEDLEITIDFNGNQFFPFIQDASSPFPSGNTYFTTTGSWTKNRDFEGVEMFEVEMDDTTWTWGYNLSLSADGSWTFNAESDFDPGTYDLTVSMRAEGQLFENTASFTIEDK